LCVDAAAFLRRSVGLRPAWGIHGDKCKGNKVKKLSAKTLEQIQVISLVLFPRCTRLPRFKWITLTSSAGRLRYIIESLQSVVQLKNTIIYYRRAA
jgi:hypothetical protein